MRKPQLAGEQKVNHLTRRLAYGAVTLFAVLVAGVVAVIWYSVAESLRAERALHANLLVVDVVRSYVKDTKGAWPRSWADLERVGPREEGMFRWPDDKAAVQGYVEVDFAADPNKMAHESVEELVAIQPKGPCYPYEGRLRQLLQTIREFHPDGKTPR